MNSMHKATTKERESPHRLLLLYLIYFYGTKQMTCTDRTASSYLFTAMPIKQSKWVEAEY